MSTGHDGSPVASLTAGLQTAHDSLQALALRHSSEALDLSKRLAQTIAEAYSSYEQASSALRSKHTAEWEASREHIAVVRSQLLDSLLKSDRKQQAVSVLRLLSNFSP